MVIEGKTLLHVGQVQGILIAAVTEAGIEEEVVEDGEEEKEADDGELRLVGVRLGGGKV